jgi:hypothetical protein
MTEYCYSVTAVNSHGAEGAGDDACAETLPPYQAFLQVNTSLANSDVAAEASPFGDFTGDGVADAVLMVEMVSLLPVNGYQFDFSLAPGVVGVIGVADGVNVQFLGCVGEAMAVGMDQASAAAYCESLGYSSGFQIEYSGYDSGTVIAFDMQGQAIIPPAYQKQLQYHCHSHCIQSGSQSYNLNFHNMLLRLLDPFPRPLLHQHNLGTEHLHHQQHQLHPQHLEPN